MRSRTESQPHRLGLQVDAVVEAWSCLRPTCCSIHRCHSTTMRTEDLPLQAFNHAVWHVNSALPELVHHSDRGSQGGFNWSPGRPTVAWRQDRVRFWAAIAGGAMTEDAAAGAGVSSPVGFRWFRHAGGVNPPLPEMVSGRYVSSDERDLKKKAKNCARTTRSGFGRRTTV